MPDFSTNSPPLLLFYTYKKKKEGLPMEFSINRNSFLEKLNTASRAIGAHSPVPALSGVLIQVREDHLVLTGSDSELVIQTTIVPDEKNQLVIASAGSIVVDSRLLLELIRKMSGETIQIFAADPDLMHLTGPDGNFELVGRSSESYPAVHLDRPEVHFQLPAKLLADIYNEIGYAVSEKNSRQVLMGINLQLSDRVLAATATDAYRLARKVSAVDTDESCKITIPASSFAEAVRSFGDEETIDLYVNRKKVQFVFDHTVIQSTLFEGTYPDSRAIIPTQFVSTLVMNRSDLEGMLNRSAIYTISSSSSGNIVPIRMECTGEGVFIRVLTSDVGSCRQSFSDVEYMGSDIVVSYNAKLMLDALKGLGNSKKVSLAFTGELRPIKITNPDDPTLTMIVVPLRAREG